MPFIKTAILVCFSKSFLPRMKFLPSVLFLWPKEFKFDGAMKIWFGKFSSIKSLSFSPKWL
ncbi:hypothetical protein QM027_01835 [Campylobacter concisus]